MASDPGPFLAARRLSWWAPDRFSLGAERSGLASLSLGRELARLALGLGRDVVRVVIADLSAGSPRLRLASRGAGSLLPAGRVRARRRRGLRQVQQVLYSAHLGDCRDLPLQRADLLAALDLAAQPHDAVDDVDVDGRLRRAGATEDLRLDLASQRHIIDLRLGTRPDVGGALEDAVRVADDAPSQALGLARRAVTWPVSDVEVAICTLLSLSGS